jgi:hypothetical protein
MSVYDFKISNNDLSEISKIKDRENIFNPKVVSSQVTPGLEFHILIDSI